MATRRIKEITNTATTFASDDFIALDGTSQGTRKMDKDDLISQVSAGVSGDYLEEANNLSDVASKDTSKLNLEVPDVGTAPNEVPLNGQLGSMAYQSAEAVSVAKAEVESTTGTATTQALTVTDGTDTNFVVQEDGRVGIGTSSPGSYDGNSDDLVLQTGGHTGLTIRSSSTATGNVNFADGTSGDERYRGYVSYNHSTDTLKFGTSATERCTIDSSGRVGISNNSPGDLAAAANNLVVGSGSGNEGLTIFSASDGEASIYFADGTTGNEAYRSYIVCQHASDNLVFGTAGSNRCTIDSSGNLGIGTASPSAGLHLEQASTDNVLAVVGQTGYNGTLFLAADGSGKDTYLTVGGNRNLLVDFATSSTPAATGTTKFTFSKLGNLVMTGGGGIDFGSTSDGSGTMSSEVLDDYEEGTWTPLFHVTSGSFTTMTMDVISARYVKVGHLVNFQCYIRTNDVNTTGTGGQLTIEGLPYANAGSNNFAACYVGYAQDWATAPAAGYVVQGGSFIYLTKRVTGITGDLTEMVAGDMTTGAVNSENQLMISGSYCSF